MRMDKTEFLLQTFEIALWYELELLDMRGTSCETSGLCRDYQYRVEEYLDNMFVAARHVGY